MTKDRKPNGYWTKETTFKETIELKAEKGWKQIPGFRVLTSLGYSSLGFFINKYYGFSKLRILLGEKN